MVMGAVRAMPVGFDILLANGRDRGLETGILGRGIPAVGCRGWGAGRGAGGAVEAADRKQTGEIEERSFLLQWIFVSSSGLLSIGVARQAA